MLLLPYTVATHSSSRASVFSTLATALLISGCYLSGRGEMEEASNQPPHATTSVLSAVISEADDDGTLLVQQHVADELASMPSSIGVGATNASYTDDPVFLASLEVQMCNEITIIPGTSRRIPYVLPVDWRYLDNRVHVRKVPEQSNLDYHVELLREDFSFYGAACKGLLLSASVPPTSQQGEHRESDETESVATSLKLILQVRLEPLSVSGDVGPGASLTVGSTLAVSAPGEVDHLSDFVTAMGSPGDGYLAHSTSVLLPDSIAFGVAAWKEYFGVNVGREPDLPVDIESILSSRAPFLLEGERAPQCVRDNHLLTLIPATVNGEAFTLDKLGALLLRNYKGHFAACRGNSKKVLGYGAHGYNHYSPFLTEVNRRTSLKGASYWALLPKTVLKNSRNKPFSYQKKIIAKYGGGDYKLPCALEVATSLLAHYARHGEERLYANKDETRSLWTYTRCSDVDKNGYPLVVGGFEPSGLDICSNYVDDVNFGVTCLRKL